MLWCALGVAVAALARGKHKGAKFAISVTYSSPTFLRCVWGKGKEGRECEVRHENEQPVEARVTCGDVRFLHYSTHPLSDEADGLPMCTACTREHVVVSHA